MRNLWFYFCNFVWYMKFFKPFIYPFHDIIISKLTRTKSCTKMPFTLCYYLNVGIFWYLCQNSQILQSSLILLACPAHICNGPADVMMSSRRVDTVATLGMLESFCNHLHPSPKVQNYLWLLVQPCKLHLHWYFCIWFDEYFKVDQA